MLDCKTNFKMSYQDNMTCRLCKDTNSLENEDHILTCSVLNSEKNDIEFNDVYGSIEQQYKAIKVFKKVIRKRKVYLYILEKDKTNNPSV